MRRVFQKLEFDRQIGGRFDVAVDTGNEGGDQPMRRWVHRGCIARRDLVDPHRQVRHVGGNEIRAQYFRLPPQRPPAKPVHLPQAILRHGNAEAEKQVRRIVRKYMRHPGAIALDLHRRSDGAGDRLVMRLRLPRQEAVARRCKLRPR